MSAARDVVARILNAHVEACGRLGEAQAAALGCLAESILAAWQAGGKLLVCGNGGSAADSQHLAAELAGRFQRSRPGWAAMALTTDSSALTAISNDFGFEQVFARQVEALGRPGDVLLVISTSGDSANCRQAVHRGRALGLRCHGLLGRDGGALAQEVDQALIVPAIDTPRIQELHLIMIHALCELLEETRLGPAEG